MSKPTRRRRSIRLKGYDYTQSGGYFVTICTHQQTDLFGAVIDDEMRLNAYGQIAYHEWLKSAEIRQEIEIDEFVVMPNHLHGIVFINKDVSRRGDDLPAHRRGEWPVHRRGDRPVAPTARGPAPKSLGALMAGYKSAVTKQINQRRGSPGAPVWQRNYYEHIIRNEKSLDAIREYIAQNPRRWALDRYNPEAVGQDPHAATLWKLLQEN